MIDTKALRSRILDLAIQGKLTEQLPSDGTAEELYQQIQAEKQALIKEGKIKKEKPLPEISADEVPFEIPENWMWVRLSSIIDVRDGTHDSPKYHSEGIPLITSKNLSSGKLDFENVKLISYEDAKKINERSYVENGDILFAMIGTIGNPVIVDTDKEFCIKNVALFKRYKGSEFNMNYLYYFLLMEQYEMQKITLGGLQPFVSLKLFRSHLVPLPPLAEQKRIVERVEEIFHLLDTIDQAQEKYSADSQILKAKLITAGIQGKLTKQLPSDGTAEELYQQIQAEKQKLIKEGKLKKEKPLPPVSPEEVPFEIPENWMWVRLVDITTKITSGSTPSGGKKGNSYVPQGFCFFREQNIYNDGIHHDGMVYISEELLNTRENSTVLPNDILLNITGGSIGRCAIIPDDFSKGSINQHILIIRLVEKEMINYIHDLLCSPYYQGIIKSKVVGDKDGFSGGRCKATLIPLPPLAEQKRIADVLEKALGALDKV